MIVRVARGEDGWFTVEVYSGEEQVASFLVPEVRVPGVSELKLRTGLRVLIVEAERVELYMEDDTNPATSWAYVLPREG